MKQKKFIVIKLIGIGNNNDDKDNEDDRDSNDKDKKNVMKRDNKYECEYNDNNEDENKYIRDNNEDENSVYWC